MALFFGSLAKPNERRKSAFLLGSHGADQKEDGLLKEAVRRIVEGWPPPPFRIAGRDQGRKAERFLASIRRQARQRIPESFRGGPSQVRRRCRTRRPRGRQWAFGKEASYRPLRAGRADRRRSAFRQGSAQGRQMRGAAGAPVGQETGPRRS